MGPGFEPPPLLSETAHKKVRGKLSETGITAPGRSTYSTRSVSSPCRLAGGVRYQAKPWHLCCPEHQLWADSVVTLDPASVQSHKQLSRAGMGCRDLVYPVTGLSATRLDRKPDRSSPNATHTFVRKKAVKILEHKIDRIPNSHWGRL